MRPDVLPPAAAELLHDLLGLLTVLEGRSAMVHAALESGSVPLAESRAALEDCRDLRSMVHDLLESTRSDAAVRAAPIALREAVGVEIERALRSGGVATIHLHDHLASEIYVVGPGSFLRRALSNVLRNAMRHARGEVVLRMEAEVRSGIAGVLIRVDDDGRGIHPSLERTLFQPGVHGGHGGFGLGLASARACMERLGGTLALGGRSSMGGARMELWVPRDLAALHRQTGSDRPRLSGLTIALVDDSPEIRDVFARVLRRAGAQVVPLAPGQIVNAPDGLGPLRELRADLLALDFMMGSVNGIDLWTRLRSVRPDLAGATVFLTGAPGGLAGRDPGGETGCPVLPKGIGIHEMIERVAELARDRSGSGSPR